MSSAEGGRRLDVQGLRALAVLMVVVYHAGLPFSGGFVGVDVFFVISGFVITAMLMREWRSTGRIRFAQFYLRRFKRLTPALALMVAVVAAASVVLLSPLGAQQTAAKTALGTILLVANFVIDRSTGDYFDAPAETNPLLNTWSLSVEEQFYLVFPAILGVAWLMARRRRSSLAFPVVAVGAVAAVSFGLALIGASGTSFGGSSLVLGFYSPFTRAWEFAVGALLALLASRVAPGRVPATACGVAGVALLGASLWAITGTTTFPGPATLLPVVGTLLLLVAGSGAANPVSGLLATRPLVWVGDLSYSVYLWHWPFIVFARLLWPGHDWVLVAAALLSFLPAIASYHLVEQPIRLSRPGRGRLGAIVAATLLPPLVLAVGLWAVAGRGLWQDDVVRYQAAVLPVNIVRSGGCEASVEAGERGAAACTWNGEAAGAPVYLVGDSNAQHFAEGVIDAGQRLGRPVVAAASTACPFLDGPASVQAALPEQDAHCRDTVQRTLGHLSKATPGLVLVSMSDRYWFGLASPGEDGTYRLDRERSDALVSALTATLERIREGGHRVLLLQSIPKWTTEHPWRPDTCTTLSIVRGTCREEMTVDQALVRQGAIREAFTAAAAAAEAVVYDPWTVLCPDGRCSTHDGDLVRYRDESHVTVEQSQAMAEPFAAAIADVG